MTPQDGIAIHAALLARNFTLESRDGRLIVRPGSRLSPEDSAAIRASRLALVASVESGLLPVVIGDTACQEVLDGFRSEIGCLQGSRGWLLAWERRLGGSCEDWQASLRSITLGCIDAVASVAARGNLEAALGQVAFCRDVLNGVEFDRPRVAVGIPAIVGPDLLEELNWVPIEKLESVAGKQ